MTTLPRTDARMTRLPAARRLVADLDHRPDAELLDRFARYGERPALETLVRRHAPLVRGVCRRHLGDTPDADDAFQATFLVLLRHTGRGRPPAKVGPWLYSVAVRTSGRLRSRRRFAPLPEVAAPEAPPADALPLLDRELAGLPARYRDALILCELQGKSRREAAGLLGIAEGTLSSRLSRGKELLRRRLLKHGTLLPAAGLAGLVPAATAGDAATVLALADGAVPVAVAVAVPPSGWGLWKLAAVAAVAACGGLALVPGGEPPKATEPAKPAAVAKPEPAKPAGPAVPDPEALQGLWLIDEFPLSDAARKKIRADKNVRVEVLDAEMANLLGRPGLVVAGGRWWQIIREDAIPFDFRIIPERNPKWLDRTWVTGLLPSRQLTDDKPFRGIYGLAGDRLTVCDPMRGGQRRPADLTLVDDTEWATTIVLRKAPPPPPEQLAAVKPLLGHWKLVSGQHNTGGDGGVRAMTDGWLEVTPYALFLRWGHDGTKQFTAAQGGPLVMAADFTLDGSKNHPWIDLQVWTTLEDGKPGERFGVYELAGDTLKLVFGHDRTFRPLDFVVEPYPTKPGEPLKGPNPQTECFEFKRAAP